MKITIEFEVDEKSLFQKTSAGSAVLGLEVLLEHLRSVKAREPEDSGVQQVDINGPPTECPTHGTVFPLLVGCPLCTEPELTPPGLCHETCFYVGCGARCGIVVKHGGHFCVPHLTGEKQ